MTERRFIELWYSQHETEADGTRVADGARLDGRRVCSGVAVDPEQVQAVAVHVQGTGLLLTLKGGARVLVAVHNPSPSPADLIAHLRKAAVEIRVQVARNPEGLLPFDEVKSIDDPEEQAAAAADQRFLEDNLLELVGAVRDLCAEEVAGNSYHSEDEDVGDARDDLVALNPADLLKWARTRLRERGHALGAT